MRHSNRPRAKLSALAFSTIFSAALIGPSNSLLPCALAQAHAHAETRGAQTGDAQTGDAKNDDQAVQAGNIATRLLSDWAEDLSATDGITVSFSKIVPGDFKRSAVIENGRIDITLPRGLFEPGKTVRISATFDRLTIDGLRVDGDMLYADSLAFPTSLDVSISSEPATGTEKPGAAPEAAEPSAERFDVSYGEPIFEGLSLPLSWPSTSTDTTPSSLALSALETFRKVGLARAFIGEATATTKSGEGLFHSGHYEDISLLGLTDGRLSEQRTGRVRFLEKLPTGDAGRSLDMTFDDIVLRGLDIVPFISLLGAPAEDGRVTILEREEVSGIAFSDGNITGTIGAVALEDLSVTDSRPLRFASLVDREAQGETVSESELAIAAIETLAAFNLGRFEINSLDLATGAGQASLRRFLVKNGGGKGIGALGLDDLTLGATGEGQLHLGHASLANLTFPPAKAIAALENQSPPSADTLVDALPTLGKLIVSSLEFLPDAASEPNGSATDTSSTIALSLLELAQSGFVSNIPTRNSLIIDGVMIPIDYVDDPNLRRILEGLGIDDLEINQSLGLKWDPATLDLTISDLTVHLLNGGILQMTLQLGNVPRTLFTNPMLAEIALASSTFKSASLRLQGAELLDGLIQREAEDAGMTRAELADGLAEALAAEIGTIAASAFGQELTDALHDFVEKPDEIRVEARPQTAVPVTELVGMALASPETLPDRLGAKVLSGE